MLLSPVDVKITKLSEKGNVGVFVFEPLPQTFGHTLGNTLRRVLLTSLEGAAITQVKFDGVVHQFSNIPGVKEDVVELGLNFKNIRAKVHGERVVVVRISKKGPGEITAGDIEENSDIEILNKGLHLATLSDKSAKFDAEIVFEIGVGYSPIEDRETSKIGVVLLDALFSPVSRAEYKVEPTRFGRKIGLDKLTLTIETDGSIKPEDAVKKASSMLRDFFGRFSDGEDRKEQGDAELGVAGISTAASEEVLVDELPLPTRTINALKRHGVENLRQLTEMSGEELADVKNLGEKSVNEIKKLLIGAGYKK